MKSGGAMDAFYRQTKPKPKPKPTGAVSKKASHRRPTAGADLHPGGVDVGDDDVRRQEEEAEEEEEERVAREFDMDMRYGPCLGLTRLQRWHRAAALGLAPPPAVLRRCSDGQGCLWEGRV